MVIDDGRVGEGTERQILYRHQTSQPMALTPMRTPTTMPNILKKVSQPDASVDNRKEE
jgi:hypothetical protein